MKKLFVVILTLTSISSFAGEKVSCDNVRENLHGTFRLYLSFNGESKFDDYGLVKFENFGTDIFKEMIIFEREVFYMGDGKMHHAGDELWTNTYVIAEKNNSCAYILEFVYSDGTMTGRFISSSADRFVIQNEEGYYGIYERE